MLLSSTSFLLMWPLLLLLLNDLFFPSLAVEAYSVVLAGGTGPLGQAIASQLEPSHDVWILTRNAFLAAAPNRVTEQFGYVGKAFLEKHPAVQLRDWDGGDLLDIVGQDWVGWQQDTLPSADVIVHLTGGFTPQRVQACERLVRESLQYNKEALHLTASPVDDDMAVLPPLGAVPLKQARVKECEDMVAANCANFDCLRLECYRVEEGAQRIIQVIDSWTTSAASS